MLGPQTQHKGAVYLSYVLLVAKGVNFAVPAPENYPHSPQCPTAPYHAVLWYTPSTSTRLQSLSKLTTTARLNVSG